MKDKKYYIQVVVAMIGGLILSHICLAVFFPMKSPTLRANIPAYITEKSGVFLASAGNLIPKFSFPFSTQTRLEENSTTYTPEPTQTSGTPEVVFTSGQSQTAAGIRQSLGTQKLTQSLPGVYVTQNATSCLTVLKQSEVAWLEQSIKIKGETVKIRVPAGQPAPPQVLE